MQNQLYPSLRQSQQVLQPVILQPQPNQQISQNGFYASPIIINNPNMVMNSIETRNWSSSLFGCFDDIGECCFAFFCPLCYQIKLFSDANESCFSCLFGGLVPLRTKIRTQNRIQGSICNDYCVLIWCNLCSIVQMGIELKNTKLIL